MRIQVLSVICGVALMHSACCAEMKVDERTDEFSLSDTSAQKVALKFQQDQAVLDVAGLESKPKTLLIHFFQPDCLQCQVQMKAEEALYQDVKKNGVAIIGISHRGTPESVKEIGAHLKLSFPLLVGTDSEIAKKCGSGDALYILDEKGIVRFSQAGYGAGDEKLWKENIELLTQGKPVAKKTTARERLKAGDRLPAVALNNLLTGKPIKLAGQDDKLTFTDEEGKTIQPTAAIGFFCRF